MLHALNLIYSVQFWVGGVLALVAQRIYRCRKARYDDKHAPLPDGRRHRVHQIDRVWIAGLVFAVTIGYVLLSAERARDQTARLTGRFHACQVNAQESVNIRVDIAGQDSDISNQISDVRSSLDEALATMMHQIIDPPPEIAALNMTDPRRLAWNQDAEIVWTERSATLRSQIEDLTRQRKQLAVDRLAHPVPPFSC